MGKRKEAPWAKKSTPEEEEMPEEEAQPSKKVAESEKSPKSAKKAAKKAKKESNASANNESEHIPREMEVDTSAVEKGAPESSAAGAQDEDEDALNPASAKKTKQFKDYSKQEELSIEEKEKRAALASIDGKQKAKRQKQAAALIAAANASTPQKGDKKQKKAKPCKNGLECPHATCRFSHPAERCPRGADCSRGSTCLLHHPKKPAGDAKTGTKGKAVKKDAGEGDAAEETKEEATADKKKRPCYTWDKKGTCVHGDDCGFSHDIAPKAPGNKYKDEKNVKAIRPDIVRDVSARQQSLLRQPDDKDGGPPDVKATAESFGLIKKAHEPRGLYQMFRLDNKIKFTCSHTGKPTLSSNVCFNLATGELLSNGAYGQLAPKPPKAAKAEE